MLKRRSLAIPVALMVTAAGCAGQSQRSAVPTPLGDRITGWQQEMDTARRLAAAGQTYVLITPTGVYDSYNNPSPFCYAYTIPGDWKAAEEPALFRFRKDDRAFVGVLFLLLRDLESFEGGTVVERAGTAVARGFERALHLPPLAGGALAPFQSKRAGTWKLTADALERVRLPAKVIVDLSPDAVAVITVGGTTDNDELARRVIANLRTTSNPECYWADLEAF